MNEPRNPQGEAMEAMTSLARGQKGDQGERGNQGNRGERGQRGMPPGQRRAIVVLFILSFVLAGSAFLASVHYYQVSQAAQRRQQRQEQVSQQRQSAIFEHKLCTTLNGLAREKPPPGSPGSNPSRAYLQGQHVILAQLGPDVGCTRTTP